MYMGEQMYSQLLGSRPRFVQTTILGFFILFGLVLLQRQRAHINVQPTFSDAEYIPVYRETVPRIAKVSMLYGKANGLYQRAVASHERHSAIHGYPMHILRNDLAQNYWNKPAYLMSRLLQEMEKDPGDRVDWLMWFDADSIVLNLDIPVDMFLPPPDKKFDEIGSKHFLVTKDRNGLNTGIFFLRVNEWSIQFMAKTMAYTQYKPDVDLGASADQRAMELLINETHFRPHTAFVPKTWINAYVDQAHPGSFLVHFPGLVDRDWHMKIWLSRIEGVERTKWRMPVEETEYPKSASEFWNTLYECNVTTTEMGNKLNLREHVPQHVKDAVVYFYDSCWYRSDEHEHLARARENAEAAMRSLEEEIPPPPPEQQ